MNEVTANPYPKLEHKSIYFEAFTPLQLLNKMINLYKICWLLISTKTRAFNEKYKLSYPGLNSFLMNCVFSCSRPI